MPSNNKTTNYKLNQWQGNEYPKRQDFVDDNAVIDTQMKTNADAAASATSMASAAATAAAAAAAAIPGYGTSAQNIGTSAAGTASSVSRSDHVHALPDVATTANTSAASPADGGTFTAVDSVTTDGKGRVTAVNTKTVTLPTILTKILTGFSTSSSADVTASDTILSALGKFQAKFAAIATAVLNTALAGFVTTTNAVVTAADTIVVAIGKLQAQVSANLTLFNAHKSRHATGGGDALAPSDIGAVSTTGSDMTGILSVQTPNNGSTGGLRVKHDPTSGMGIIQFLNQAMSTQYGYISVDTSGIIYWTGKKIGLRPDMLNAGGWGLVQAYNTAGTYTWTVPDLYGDGRSYMIGWYVIGAGGSGSVVKSQYTSGGAYASGGCAGYVNTGTMTVTPGTGCTVVVGAGGARVSIVSTGQYAHVSTAGNAGGSSSFNGNTANGGSGGTDGSLSLGGQGADVSNSTYPKAPAMGQPPYTSASYVTYDAIRSYQSLVRFLNPFNQKRYLSAGGSASALAGTSSGSVSTCQTTVSQLDDPAAGTGGNAAAYGGTNDQNTQASDATGYGNGGGSCVVAIGNAPLNCTATSGKGADGAVLIYARGVLAQ